MRILYLRDKKKERWKEYAYSFARLQADKWAYFNVNTCCSVFVVVVVVVFVVDGCTASWTTTVVVTVVVTGVSTSAS
jgi:hypothetical protein